MKRNKKDLEKEINNLQVRVVEFLDSAHEIQDKFIDEGLEGFDLEKLNSDKAKLTTLSSSILLSLNDLIFGNDETKYELEVVYYDSHIECERAASLDSDTEIFDLVKYIKRVSRCTVELMNAIEYFKNDPNIEMSEFSSAAKELVFLIKDDIYSLGEVRYIYSPMDNFKEVKLFLELKKLYESNKLNVFLNESLMKLDLELTKTIFKEKSYYRPNYPITVNDFFKRNSNLVSSSAVMTPLLFKTAVIKEDKVVANSESIDIFKRDILTLINLINELEGVTKLIERNGQANGASGDIENEKAVDILGESILKQFVSTLVGDIEENVLELKVKDIFKMVKSFVELITVFVNERKNKNS